MKKTTRYGMGYVKALKYEMDAKISYGKYSVKRVDFLINFIYVQYWLNKSGIELLSELLN